MTAEAVSTPIPQDDKGYALFLQGILTMHQYLMTHMLGALVADRHEDLIDMLPVLSMAVEQMDDLTDYKPTPEEVAECLRSMKAQMAELLRKNTH